MDDCLKTIIDLITPYLGQLASAAATALVALVKRWYDKRQIRRVVTFRLASQGIPHDEIMHINALIDNVNYSEMRDKVRNN